ncbi:RidA family protein [Paracnuella aquatica]|uniref:RidA family protein n=1 Tax=Paracnuella aquatica TaxID=2268757 RepID=UPI000DEF1B3C|nr:RidA family protein [Paracnuella aquatica]RPD43564.1 RidA family protein [Paracnuella aquatica]
MKKVYASLVALALLTTAGAQQAPIAKTKMHWGTGSNQDTTYGYAQSLLVDNVLYISGVPGHGPDMATQLQHAYHGIEAMLKAHGATFAHVVKETLFTTDIAAVERQNAVRKAFYKGDFPAASWVQITRLLMPQAMVEIEVIAHLPKK